MMHDKAMRSLSAVISSLICSGFVACAGNDTPAVDDDLESAIAQGFSNGAVAAAGAGGRASSGATRPAGNAGSASAPAAGAGGSGGNVVDPPAGAAGAGQAEPPPAPSTGGACDGFAVLATNCGSSACHGEGSGLGNFAESEDAAKAYVGTSGTVSCSAEGPLLNPENPRQSIIVQKVNGTVPCGGDMPIGDDPLTDDEISCLEEWIGTL